MDHGHGAEILTGLDAVRFLCSTDKKQACMTKSSIFSKLFSETQARETIMISSPPPTSMLCSPRKQRKAYKPSRVQPLEEEEPMPHVKSAPTDDPASLNAMSSYTISHGDPCSSKKKVDISGNSSFIDNGCSVVKTTKGKRKKRPNRQCNATVVCKNLACKAVLHLDATFCRRCSCCICKEFDDNKDPSLWITCDAEEQHGCGLSCHVECALHDKVAGVINMGGPASLDGSFFCRSCGKVSSLIGLWKKQLLIAKNARRVDVLCHRLLLSHKLLKGTLKYKDAHTLIDRAAKKLEVEVGLMTKCSAKLERCIVNRLSCNGEVQNLVDLALERVESLHNVCSGIVTTENAATCKNAPCTMQFEDACSSSIVVVAVDYCPCDDRLGYKLWHRKATDPSYPEAPTHTIESTSRKVLVSNLQPCTLYAFKMAPFSAGCDGEECEAECCTEGIESTAVEIQVNDGILDSMRGTNNGEARIVQDLQQHSSQCIQKGRRTEKGGGAMEDLSNGKTQSVSEVDEGKDYCSVEVLGDARAAPSVVNEEHESQLTVAKEKLESSRQDVCETMEPLRVMDRHEELESQKEVFSLLELTQAAVTTAANVDIMDDSNGAPQSWAMQLFGKVMQGSDGKDASPPATNSKVNLYNWEFSIRVIRWLEHAGHLDREFRVKFLTWYSLRATEHEKRVVSVFIDTFQDNAASLAEQLVDTFQDVINTKRQTVTEVSYYRRCYR